LRLNGDRPAIRAGAVAAAIALLSTALDRERGDRQT